MSSPDVESAPRAPFRVRAHGSSPHPSVSLSHEHVFDALRRSPDNGATLDFAKQNLTDVGESGIEELATIGGEDLEDQSSVLRIALSNNRLTTLPMAFALLSRLRYLNLKNNNFSVFPEVLTVMPSLDTLDVSHNKIKRLPSQPGSLINLRVFCFSRNKVTRIPSNFAEFRNLDILKSDRNPIEWPPKSVMEPRGGLTTAQGMKDWIHSVQKWMEVNTSKTDLSLSNHDQLGLDSNIEDRKSWRPFPIGRRSDADFALHSRSFSRDSNFSMSSIEESQQEVETPLASSLQLERPYLHSRGPSPSSSRTPESYLPSPEESADESFTVVSNIIRQQQNHYRNSSHTVDRHGPTRPDLPGNKSMPDLRTAKINFSRKVPDLTDSGLPGAQDLPNNIMSLNDFSIPSPLSQRHDSGSSEEPAPLRPAKTFARNPVGESSTPSDQPAPSMELERNSYFRRFSALTSTIASTTIPEPLLRLIDSARSILFAVSQVYQTLQHYTVFVIDDRLSSVLRKVLDPASADMMQLINSLDRFDSVSRKIIPPPVVCRAVVESCKDTVAVFGKAVGVLSLQLKVLASRDDVRYLRQMLLVLYGATAEIAFAWQTMVPHIEAVKPLLYERRRPPPAKSHLGHSPTASFFTEPHFSSPDGFTSHYPTERPSLSRTHSEDVIDALELGRTHTARRHAGSFSSKDVEIGKILPSYEEVPFLSTGLNSCVTAGTPALRLTKRKLAAATSNSGLPSPSSSVTSPSQSQTQSSPWPPATAGAGAAIRAGKLPSIIHSRQGSQASAPSPSPPSLAKPPHIDIPSNSRSLVDKEALDAMRVAVDAAPAVWDMVNEILADFLDTNVEVRETLLLARIVTNRLRENILAVQQGDVAADRKNLREDAHLFVKTVVQLSNVIKMHGSSHAMSSALRTKMVTLTNSTEEFVILLHVSSFSPAISRSFSPMLSPSLVQASPLGPGGTEDSRLGASLSRSRNNHSGLGMKFTMHPPRDGSRSALPNQSFNVPAISRLPGRRGTSFDEEVLG